MDETKKKKRKKMIRQIIEKSIVLFIYSFSFQTSSLIIHLIFYLLNLKKQENSSEVFNMVSKYLYFIHEEKKNNRIESSSFKVKAKKIALHQYMI